MFAFSKHAIEKRFTAVVPTENGLSIAAVHNDSCGIPQLDVCEFVAWDSAAASTELLQKKVKQFGLTKRPCTTIMDLGEYSVLSVEAPDVPQSELRAAIRWQIKDLIDFHIDDALVDVFNAPASGADGRHKNLYVVVSRMSTVKQRIQALQAGEVNVTTIDIPEMVLRNISARLPEEDAGVALIYLAKERGLIVLTRQSTLYLARTLDVGYQDFLTPFAGPQFWDSDQDNRYERLVLEVQRSLDYYDRYFVQPPIASLVVAPMDEELPGLLPNLEQHTGIRSRMLDLNEVFQSAIPLDRDLQAKCLMAIGAAMRQEKTIL